MIFVILQARVYIKRKATKIKKQQRMKYIEKSRLEIFLKSKGYQVDSSETTIEERKANNCWCKSDKEKVNVPKKDIFQSNDLPGIFNNIDLLEEFRRF